MAERDSEYRKSDLFHQYSNLLRNYLNQIFLHAIFPACLPKILTSLRISIGTSIAVLFFVESFATENGLGFFILDAWSTPDYLSMYTGIMGMGGLGVILYEGVDRIERKYCRWMFNA